MPVLALNTRPHEILTDAMAVRIRAAADGAYELAVFKDLDSARYAEVEIMFGAIDYATAAKLTGLKWLQLTTAGVDKSNDKAKYPHPDFRLSNATGAFGEHMAEHILGFFLGFARGLHLFRDMQHRRVWDDSFNPAEIKGSTVAVIGLGDIGMATASRCNALGARVLACKRSQADKPSFVEQLFTGAGGLDEALAQADYIALCLPLTPDTEGIIDARRIQLMKDGAVFVNVGRGGLVDQAALTERLQQGSLHAGLDVMTPEPLGADSPLWALPNCWITPHMAGKSSVKMDVICGIFAENIARYIAGQPLRNQVDFGTGY